MFSKKSRQASKDSEQRKAAALRLFRQGKEHQEIADSLGVTRSTITEYLLEDQRERYGRVMSDRMPHPGVVRSDVPLDVFRPRRKDAAGKPRNETVSLRWIGERLVFDGDRCGDRLPVVPDAGTRDAIVARMARRGHAALM